MITLSTECSLKGKRTNQNINRSSTGSKIGVALSNDHDENEMNQVQMNSNETSMWDVQPCRKTCLRFENAKHSPVSMVLIKLNREVQYQMWTY